MDPLTIASLIGLGLSAVGQIPQLIQTPEEKARKKRIDELQRLKDADKLGLTDAQKAELQSLGMSPIQALQREQRARAGETIGIAEVGAGGLIAQQASAQQGVREAARQVGDTLKQIDLQRQQVQEQELQGLRDRQEQVRQQRKQQIVEGALDLAVGGTQVVASTLQARQQGLLQGDQSALAAAIASDLESGNAYITTEGGQVRFSPAMVTMLESNGYSQQNIAFLEGTPKDVLVNMFRQRALTPVFNSYLATQPPVGTNYGYIPVGPRR